MFHWWDLLITAVLGVLASKTLDSFRREWKRKKLKSFYVTYSCKNCNFSIRTNDPKLAIKVANDHNLQKHELDLETPPVPFYEQGK